MSAFSYPPPDLVVTLDFESLRQQRIAGFLEVWAQLRAIHTDLPDYNVQTLQSDPASAVLRLAAHGDMHFRGHLNDVARATLLTEFARGADLELHGLQTRIPGFADGMTRHPGELDPAFAARIQEARAGASAAGPDEWWLAQARAADPRIRSIGLDYRGQGRLEIYLLSKEDGGIPDAAMLTAVTARLTRTDVRPRNVMPAVHSAIIDQVAVTADIWLTPSAAESRLTEIEASAVATHNANQALDVDLTHHYLKRLLDADDVYDLKITAPATDLIADPSRAYAISSISLNLRGRAR